MCERRWHRRGTSYTYARLDDVPSLSSPSPVPRSPDSGCTLDVALVMLTLVPDGMGGSETYARELTRELAARPGLDVCAYVARAGSGFSEGVRDHVVTRVPGGASTRERLLTLARSSAPHFAEHCGFSDATVVHYPFTVPVPAPARRQARVVSLLDVQHRDLPELFSTTERLYRRRYYDRAAKRADAVITISEFTKLRIIEHLDIPADRIFVARLGVDPSEFAPNLGERARVLLYPARGWPHKNHARLLDAFTLLRRSEPDLRLVLTGGGLEAIGPVPDGVEVRGLIPREELRVLYRTSAALVFPSLYEGFGLPPLEAMASGCPVAASDAGSLAEICGDAAVLFDGTSPESIAAGISTALDNSADLQRRGLDRARSFTWASCAEAHEAAYRFAAASRYARGDRS